PHLRRSQPARLAASPRLPARSTASRSRSRAGRRARAPAPATARGSPWPAPGHAARSLLERPPERPEVLRRETLGAHVGAQPHPLQRLAHLLARATAGRAGQRQRARERLAAVRERARDQRTQLG